MGASDYARHGWGGALLVRESVVQMTASFDDGAGEASDYVAFGAAQPGVAAAGAVKDGMDGAQSAGAAARAGPHQPNHLKRNATQPYPLLDPIPSMLYCPPSIAPFSALAWRGRARSPCVAAVAARNVPRRIVTGANAPHSDLATVIRLALHGATEQISAAPVSRPAGAGQPRNLVAVNHS